MKLFKEKVTFTSKESGEKVTCYRYYLLTENGYKLYVKPTFKDDKKTLYALANEVV